jgi:hypothetical protein
MHDAFGQTRLRSTEAVLRSDKSVLEFPKFASKIPELIDRELNTLGLLTFSLLNGSSERRETVVGDQAGREG